MRLFEYNDTKERIENGESCFLSSIEELVMCCRDGSVEGVEKNPALAAELGVKGLAASEYDESQFGKVYYEIGKTYFMLGEYKKAAEYLEKSGEPKEELSLLAQCYMYGLGVEKDLGRAAEILKKGGRFSLMFYGDLCERGEIFEKNKTESQTAFCNAFLKMLHLNGYLAYMEPRFCEMKARAEEWARFWFRPALLAIGKYYMSPDYGNDAPDYPLGVYNLSTAFDFGVAEAGEELKKYKERGYSVEKTLEAYKYLSDINSDNSALFAYIEILESGCMPKSVNDDERIERAAKLGFAAAQYLYAHERLRFAYPDGTEWLKKAAEQGHKKAAAEYEEKIAEEEKERAERERSEKMQREAAAERERKLAQTVAFADGSSMTLGELTGLTKVVVRGNKKITGVCLNVGCGGKGGSNNSSYWEKSNEVLSLNGIEGGDPIPFYGVWVVAVICDVICLADGDNIITVEPGRGYSHREDAGYDSYEVRSIYAVTGEE